MFAMFSKYYRNHTGLFFPIAVWAFSLLIAAVIVYIFTQVIIPTSPNSYGYFWSWDGGWYLGIAKSGYLPPQQTPLFFPLYPLMIYLTHLALRVNVGDAALIVSNISLLLALIFLYRLVFENSGQFIARRTLWLLIAFPTAMFFHCAYTESLNLLFIVLFFYCLQHRYWYLAIAAAFFATITHDLGVLLAFAGLAYLWVHRKEMSRLTLVIRFFSLALIPLALLVYLLYLYYITGDPKVYFTAMHNNWHTRIVVPIYYVTYFITFIYFHAIITPNWRVMMSINALSTLGMVVMGILMLTIYRRSIPAEQKVYFILTLLITMAISPNGDLQAYGRYMVVLFPGFIVWAQLCKKESLFLSSFIISFSVKTILMGMFADWYWVT